jgi:hypothetical protein
VKICKECQRQLPLTDFPHTKSSNGKRYAQPICKSCNSSPERLAARREYTKKWKAANPEKRDKSKRRHHWKKQGIDPDIAEAYYQNHDGACEICGKTTDKRLMMDHCHATGEVRGILCFNCNVGLGMFLDSTNLLDNAIKYLNSNPRISPVST